MRDYVCRTVGHMMTQVGGLIVQVMGRNSGLVVQLIGQCGGLVA